MLHRRDIRKVAQTGGNDGNDDNGGKHQSDGGYHAPQTAPVFVADKGGGIHRDDARRTLTDGVVVSQFLLRGPLFLLHHLPLEDGKHGIASAEGTYPHLGEGKKEIQINVHNVPPDYLGSRKRDSAAAPFSPNVIIR